MPWQLPVRFDRPVEITTDQVKVYPRFRVYGAVGDIVGPVPQGKAWSILSMVLQNPLPGDILYVYFERVLAGVEHIIYGVYCTGSVYTVWSPGVDTQIANDLTTRPLPALELREGDFVRIIVGGGSYTQFDVHVMEGDVQ